MVLPHHLLEVVVVLGVADVDDHHAAGSQPLARQLEELAGGQVEGDVGLAVGVDDDHVVVAVGGLEPGPRVLVVDRQIGACMSK